MQRLKIENLRKTSADISRNSTSSTSESSSSYHPTKKGSISRSGPSNGRPSIDQSRASRVKSKAGSQLSIAGSINGTTSSTNSPASNTISSGLITSPLLPPSGSSQPPLLAKRGSNPKLVRPPSPGPQIKAQSFSTAAPAVPYSDSTSTPNVQVPKRNSFRSKKNSTDSG